ncbi:MAG: glutathione S-transferase family protein [Marinovum sp.]|nr:glutathione S-transferase family protein [Marinovum sp.]
MKLYYSPASRAVRVAWLLEELGLEYDVQKFALGDRAMREPDYLAVHPMGRVPALEDKGVTLFESGAVIQYILANYGDGKFVPNVGTPEFAEYLQWFHYAEGMIMPPINTLVVETILLPPERRTELNVKRSTKLLGQMLHAVNQNLADKDYLVSDQMTAAEFMTGHAVIMAKRFGIDLTDKPNILPYVARLEARDAFQRASHK